MLQFTEKKRIGKMEDKKRKLSQLIVNEVVDHSTGEISSVSTQKTYCVNSEPEFVKLYVNDLALLSNLNKLETSTFMYLIAQMNYKNIVYVAGELKESAIEYLCIEPRTFERTIKSLKEKEVLLPLSKKQKDGSIKIKRSYYYVNPMLIAKGNWIDISKLRLSIEYENEKRTVYSETFMKNGEVKESKIPYLNK